MDSSKSAILAAEQRGIDLLKPEYNQLTAAGQVKSTNLTEEAWGVNQGMRGANSDIDKADRLEQYLKGGLHIRGSRVNKTIDSKGTTSINHAM
ncbi:hypothetical protein MJO29_016979 [Puccinia striiformis f. sp. tritici]|nr:hypothetical protein MJO29_016979 [Puccinia striiformis f. sp. tritici]